MSSRLRRALRILGGPTATSWPVIAIAILLSGLLSVVGVPMATWAEPAVRIAAILVAQASMIGVLLLARLTILRHAGTTSMPLRTLFVFVLAAYALELPFGLILEARGMATPGTLVRAAPSWAMVTLLVLATFAVNALLEQRDHHNALVAEHIRLRHTRERVPGLIERRYDETAAALTFGLHDELDRMQPLTPEGTVEALKHMGQEVVRPLSHELATRQWPIDPPPSERTNLGLEWGRLVQDASRPEALSPFVLAATIAVVSFAFITTKYGPGRGIVVLTLMILTLLAGAFALRTTTHRVRARFGALGNGIALTLVLASIGLLVGMAINLTGWNEAEATSTIVRTIVITVIAGWVTCLVGAARMQFARTQNELADVTRELEWETARANQSQYRRQRSLARTMHGPIQAAVNAAAIRLDSAVRDETVSESHRMSELAQIRHAIALLQAPDPLEAPPLQTVLDHIRATWTGVSEIAFIASGPDITAVSADPTCASALIVIVTEACSNAVRHASAKRIAVRIDSVSRRLIRVTIDDEGGRRTSEGPNGMGTRLLDEVSMSWERQITPEGSRLTVILPTSAGSERTPLRPLVGMIR